MRRVVAAKSILWFVVGVAAVVAVFRFWRGLGATTALTDLTPWGFWVGFDVMGGVALAAGGFVIAATVHVLHLRRYHAIVRPAVLTAFLGYLAVIGGLLFDLGLPWNIWHLIVFWNPHSPLFEVGWCVMLYTTVLALEFGPVVLEPARHPLLRGVYRLLKRATIPLVILGIALSTLHQSSLGSLFLIMPHRVPPLWYTPILPVLFFLSAIGLGLMMVMTESLVSSWLYEKEPERDVVGGLAKAASGVLALYLVVKVGDLAARGKLGELGAGTFAANLFLVEVAISALLPALLFALPVVRRRVGALGATAALGVAGFIMNRLDVGGIAMIDTTGTSYVPAWTEIAISLGVVAAVALVYFFVAERFNLFHAGRVDPGALKHAPPRFDGLGHHRRDAYEGALASYTLAGVLGAGLAFALLPESALAGQTVPASPVTPPGFGDGILLDGDRAGEAVVFDHLAHVRREGGATESCGKCHHLVRPGEQATGCARCHREMHRATSTFDHALHAARLAAGPGCAACHGASTDVPKDLAHGKPCLECHTRMVSAGTRLPPKAPPRLGLAPGYVEALHELCVGCHEERAAAAGKPNLAACATCHAADRGPRLDPLRPDERRPR